MEVFYFEVLNYQSRFNEMPNKSYMSTIPITKECKGFTIIACNHIYKNFNKNFICK